MNVSRLQTFIRLGFDVQAIRGLFFWPKFSVASYTLVADLKRQGIVPQTVIDVGSNVGQFAVSAAKLFPNATIHCFEPVPTSLAELRKNTNSLERVRLHEIAIGDAPGEIEFHVNSHSHSSSALELAASHKKAFPDAEVTRSISVPITTLDRALVNASIRSPCLIKIDVQGYEDRVVAGARDTFRVADYVVMEASLKPMYEGETLFLELVELMREHNFDFLRPVGSLIDPNTGEVLQIDALFGRST